MSLYTIAAVLCGILWIMLFAAGFLCSAKEQKQRTDKQMKQIQEEKKNAA